jgi:hypothetical protein
VNSIVGQEMVSRRADEFLPHPACAVTLKSEQSCNSKGEHMETVYQRRKQRDLTQTRSHHQREATDRGVCEAGVGHYGRTAVQLLSDHGVQAAETLPEAILTDRETAFYGPASRQRGLTTYQLGLETLGDIASFAKLYKPRTKGKVEKFIGLLEQDFIFETQDQVHSLS